MSFRSGPASKETASGTPASAPLPPNALLAGVIALTALVYLPVLRFQFVYDDQGIIVDNPMVKSWSYLPQYFKGQLWQYLFPDAPANYYRPLNMIFFRLNHALFGLRPMGWHAYTLLLHLVATALVFCIVRRITERPLVAVVAGVVFGVHPSHHEVVAWVSSTTESLFTVMFLAAFLAYLKSRERWTVGWMSVSCLFYAAGLLSKETAIVLPAVVFAHACIYGVDSPEKQPVIWRWRLLQAIGRASAYVPVCIVYLAVRLQVLHGFAHAQNAIAFSSVLLTLPSVVLFYLRQWLVPVQFSEFYDLPIRTHWDLAHVVLPLALLATTAGVFWYFRRRVGSREVGFALIAIAVPLLPVMNLSVFARGELVHDRYSYLPGMGAALLAGLALQPLFSGRLVFRLPQRLVLVALAILLPLCYSTANASSYWVNDSTLFRHAHEVAPENVTARNNYALQLALSGDQGAAITMLDALVKEHPDSYLGNYNLGRLLYEANILPAAEHYLLQATKADPGNPDTYVQIGLVYMKGGRVPDAEANFRHALALRPDNAKSHFALGVVMADLGNCPVARAEFSQALMLDPVLKHAQEQKDKCVVDTGPRTPAGTSALPARLPLAQVNSR